MAYSVKTMILAGTLAFSGLAQPYASGINPADVNPTSGFNLQNMLSQQLMGQAALNNLASMNGFNVGNLANANLGQMIGSAVANAVATQLTSQLMGKLGELGPMGSMLGGGMMSGMQGGLGSMLGQGNLMAGMNSGLTSSLFGNSINNSFGGLVNNVVNGVVTAAVNQGVQAIMGGIQGGGSSESSGSSTDYASLGTSTIGGSDMPVLSTTASVNESSVNYVSGNYDGMNCTQPDSRFLTEAGYDSNYWAGYKKSLASCNSVTI